LETNKKTKKTKVSKMSKKRRNRYIKNGIIGGIIVLGVLVIAIACNLVYGIIEETAEFDPEKLMRYEPFTILDSNDQEIYSYGAEPVEFEDIPQVMIDAIIAIEDSRYYEHNGFDIPRIIKAVIGNFTSGSIQSGASTITQQVIKKNYYPDEERTYQRKIGEIFLAIQADAEMEKDTILTCYLNTIDYGVGIGVKGIKSAAKYYFNKEVNQLTLPEAAYLAGVVNAPSAYDAFYNLDLATKRRNVVLDLMEMHGYITVEERDLAKSTKLENQLVGREGSGLGYEQYQAYIDAVVEEAMAILYEDIYTEEEIKANKSELIKEVLNKSITIHTYMNAGLQDHIEKEIATGDASGVVFAHDDIEIAGSIQDNYTGRIVGLLGGRDYIDYTLNENLTGSKVFGFNRATDDKVSPGSSLKPLIAYLPGVEFLDWPTFSTVTDKDYQENGVPVKNWDNRTHGSQSFQMALANSWNITAVKCLEYVCESVGTNQVIEFINGMGLTVNDYYSDNNDPYDDFNLRYAIGAWANGISMVQEAGAYATLANGGTYYKPHTINYIEFNNNGEKIMVDEEIAAGSYRAISEDSAYMVRELMKQYTPGNYSYAPSAAANCGISIGGKSGTSTNANDDTNGYIFACFTPDYAMSFWCGEDNHSNEISTYHNSTTFGAAASVIYYLHNDGAEHSYSSRPSNVASATVQLGTEPWEPIYAASEYTPDNYKVTGLYKTDGRVGISGTKLPEIAAVEKFNAESVDDKAIKVTFSDYPDTKYTTDIPEEYIKEEKPKLNPEYMYGRIMYVAVIRNKETGEEIFKKASETPTFTFDYEVNDTVEVCGRYEFSKQEKLHSEEVTVTIEPLIVELPDITYNITAANTSIIAGSTTSKNVSISVTSSRPDNIITIAISGPNYSNTKTYTGNCSMALTNLADGIYSVSITEEDARKTNKVKATTTFTVTTPTPPPSQDQNTNTGEGVNNNQQTNQTNE